MARTWVIGKGLDIEDAATEYIVMYIEDGTSRAMDFCCAHSEIDADNIVEAMKWKDALEAGRISIPGRKPVSGSKKRVTRKRTPAKRQK